MLYLLRKHSNLVNDLFYVIERCQNYEIFNYKNSTPVKSCGRYVFIF